MALDSSLERRVDEQESRRAILRQIDLDLVAVEDALSQRRQSLAEIDRKLRTLKLHEHTGGDLIGKAEGRLQKTAPVSSAQVVDENASSFAEWLREHRDFCALMQFPSGVKECHGLHREEGPAEGSAADAEPPWAEPLRRTVSTASPPHAGSLRLSVQVEPPPALHRSHSWSVSRSHPWPPPASPAGAASPGGRAPTPGTPGRRYPAACAPAPPRSPARLLPGAPARPLGRLASPPGRPGPPGALAPCRASLYSPPPRSGGGALPAAAAEDARAPAPAAAAPAAAAPAAAAPAAAAPAAAPEPGRAATPPGARAAAPAPAPGGGARGTRGAPGAPAAQRRGAEAGEPRPGPWPRGPAPGAAPPPAALAPPAPSAAALCAPGAALASLHQRGALPSAELAAAPGHLALASAAHPAVPSLAVHHGASPFVFYKDGSDRHAGASQDESAAPGSGAAVSSHTPSLDLGSNQMRAPPDFQVWRRLGPDQAPIARQSCLPADPSAAAGTPDCAQRPPQPPEARPQASGLPSRSSSSRTHARSFSEVNLGSFAEGLEQWRPPATVGSFQARTEATFAPAAANCPGGPNATYTGPQPLPRGQPQCPVQ